jgi:UDP-N-acetylglucosamine acyltransferase
MIIDGNPASVRGVNMVGLERRHFAEADIKALRVAYKKLFLKKAQNLTLSMESLAENEAASNSKVAELVSFLKASERGVTR